MKKYFVTGLIILLPITLTVLLVFFIIDFITLPFVGFIEHFLAGQAWFAEYRIPIHFLLQVLFLIFLFYFTVLLGLLARIVVFNSLLSLYDYILHRIPVIKTVYKAAQQVIKTIFGSSSRSFKQVVMVPFPPRGSVLYRLNQRQSASFM